MLSDRAHLLSQAGTELLSGLLQAVRKGNNTCRKKTKNKKQKQKASWQPAQHGATAARPAPRFQPEVGDLVLQEHPEPLFDLFKALLLFHGDCADAVRPEKHPFLISTMMFCTLTPNCRPPFGLARGFLCSSDFDGLKWSGVQCPRTGAFTEPSPGMTRLTPARPTQRNQALTHTGGRFGA